MFHNMTPPAWVEDASCGSHPEPDAWFSQDAFTRKEAQKVCAECPVQRLCLEYALNPHHRISDGVWGGRSFGSPQSRRNLRREVAA